MQCDFVLKDQGHTYFESNLKAFFMKYYWDEFESILNDLFNSISNLIDS